MDFKKLVRVCDSEGVQLTEEQISLIDSSKGQFDNWDEYADLNGYFNIVGKDNNETLTIEWSVDGPFQAIPLEENATEEDKSNDNYLTESDYQYTGHGVKELCAALETMIKENQLEDYREN